MSDDAIARLEAAALKAREFTHAIGERSYTLRLPTQREMQECMLTRGLDRRVSAMTLPLLRRYLLQEAIVGWTGVRERDAVPGGDSAPLPWSPRAVALVLDHLSAEAEALGRELLARADQRVAEIEADAKNLPPASIAPGTAAQADSKPSA